MIPCLYDKDETAYTSNGIGKLADCISCVVTEKRNGSYELEMQYPIDGIHGDELVEDNIILAQPSYNADAQPFRIYKVTTPLDGKLLIEARHISYQLNYITVSPVTVVTGTDAQVTEAFKKLKENTSVDCPFDFETDIKSTAYFGILEPMSLRSALGGVDGSILDSFGGEYEWDFYTVRLHSSRGSDNGVRIVYSKNLIDFSQDKNVENVITGVHPFWRESDGIEVTELPERVVTLTGTGAPYDKIGVLDLSDEYDTQPEPDEMRSYCQNYLKTTSYVDPDIDIDIDFAQLWQTPGYEDIAEAEKVSLCDTVHVYVTNLGYEVDAKVTETEYDTLLEKYNSITLSNAPTSSRNTSFALTVATTSKVRAMIALTDTKIRMSVSSGYATQDQVMSWIEISEEGITEGFQETLKEYSKTTDIESMITIGAQGIVEKYTYTQSDIDGMIESVESSITLGIDGITAKFSDYSTTSEVETMISAGIDGITLDYYTKDETDEEIEARIKLYDEGIELKFSDYSTTKEVETMISAGIDGITLDYYTKDETDGEIEAKLELYDEGISATYVKNGEVRSKFAMEDDRIEISSGRITFDAGTLVINSDNFSLTSGGNATFSGTLSAPGGNLGGFTIGSTSLYNSRSSLTSNTSGVYVGTDGIATGNGSSSIVMNYGVLRGYYGTSEAGYFETNHTSNGTRSVRIGSYGALVFAAPELWIKDSWVDEYTAITDAKIGESATINFIWQIDNNGDGTITWHPGVMVFDCGLMISYNWSQ